jgi:hypothetical protein
MLSLILSDLAIWCPFSVVIHCIGRVSRLYTQHDSIHDSRQSCWWQTSVCQLPEVTHHVQLWWIWCTRSRLWRPSGVGQMAARNLLWYVVHRARRQRGGVWWMVSCDVWWHLVTTANATCVKWWKKRHEISSVTFSLLDYSWDWSQRVHQSSAGTTVPLVSGLSLLWTWWPQDLPSDLSVRVLSGAGQVRPMLTPILFVLKSQRLKYTILLRIAVLGFTISREISSTVSKRFQPCPIFDQQWCFLGKLRCKPLLDRRACLRRLEAERTGECDVEIIRGTIRLLR